MSASPAVSIPTISPGEMQLLLSRAGLVLNPGQVADLVLAWRQVAGLIASLPHDRPLADDMALVFRLPPPASIALPTAPRVPAQQKPVKKAVARKATTKVPAKAKAKPKAKVKAKAKAAPKRRAAPRKSARRGR